jgi:hypothetical protein
VRAPPEMVIVSAPAARGAIKQDASTAAQMRRGTTAFLSRSYGCHRRVVDEATIVVSTDIHAPRVQKTCRACLRAAGLCSRRWFFAACSLPVHGDEFHDVHAWHDCGTWHARADGRRAAKTRGRWPGAHPSTMLPIRRRCSRCPSSRERQHAGVWCRRPDGAAS